MTCSPVSITSHTITADLIGLWSCIMCDAVLRVTEDLPCAAETHEQNVSIGNVFFISQLSQKYPQRVRSQPGFAIINDNPGTIRVKCLAQWQIFTLSAWGIQTSKPFGYWPSNLTISLHATLGANNMLHNFGWVSNVYLRRKDVDINLTWSSRVVQPTLCPWFG